jgi:hypothetical protein
MGASKCGGDRAADDANPLMPFGRDLAARRSEGPLQRRSVLGGNGLELAVSNRRDPKALGYLNEIASLAPA